MLNNIMNYFNDLNSMGQALFIVGILLVITFIILLIVVLKPDKKPKKVYGENPLTDKENQVLEKIKNIDNISMDDINIENDKTKNLKTIVDELKGFDTGNSLMDAIEKYEDEQENTAIISVNELLKASRSCSMSQNDIDNIAKQKPESNEMLFDDPVTTIKEEIVIEREQKYTPTKEIFSSVYNETEKSSEEDKEKFLNTLKEFRNNL